MKKTFKKLTAIAMTAFVCLSLGNTVLAVDVNEIEDAITAGDTETVEKLIRIDESNKVKETVDAVVSLDEESEPIIREDFPAMLGIQYEAGAGEGLLVDSNANITKDWIELAPNTYKQTVVRWGGASSENYNLKVLTEPFNQRKIVTGANLGGDADYSNHMLNQRTLANGPVEFIKTALMNNPDVEFLFCLSLFVDPQDNVDFLHFCLDDKSTEWGAKRAAYGIEDPIKFYGVELGNEDYMWVVKGDDVSDPSQPAKYIRLFNMHADAIKADFPDMKCIPNVNSNSSRAGFYEWNRPIVRELGPKYPEMAFHLYYSGYEFAYNHVWIDDMMKICEEELGPDHGIKLAFTEHGKWDTKTYVSRISLGSALATAQFLNIISEIDYITMSTYHCAIGTGRSRWALWCKTGDDTLQETSLAHMYKIYGENLGDRVLKTEVTSDNAITDPNSTGRRFTVLATPKGNKELVLFMVNRKDDTDLNLTFDFKNNYTLKKEITFSAPNFYSFPYTAASKDIFDITELDKNEKNIKSYHMPAKSLVCLVLESDKNIGSVGAGEDDEVVFEGETKFSDIKGHWAENEINFLGESGVVSGVSEGIFAPDKKISTAEFCAMLKKGLKAETIEGSAQIYPNVTSDKWYYGIINTLALKGFIRRDAEIIPEGEITLKDASSIVYRAAGSPNVAANEGFENHYPWFAGLDSYEKSAFGYVINNNIITKLFEASDSSPDRGITRAEAASLIYRFRNKLGISD